MVVRNAGIDWGARENCYWRHTVARHQAARIVLYGQSEFEASHVVLEGDQTFEVRAPVLAQGLQFQGMPWLLRFPNVLPLASSISAWNCF